MTTNRDLSLFISSKMLELMEERKALQEALETQDRYHMFGWLWEKDAGARPESIRETYLKEVEECDLYIGLFWLGYGPYTIEEFRHAQTHKKPRLIYQKETEIARRDPRLQAFLDEINEVGSGLTVCRFQTKEELAARVPDDVQTLLIRSFREKERAKQKRQKQPGVTNIRASHGGVAAHTIHGGVNVNNYGVKDEGEEEEE